MLSLLFLAQSTLGQLLSLLYLKLFFEGSYLNPEVLINIITSSKRWGIHIMINLTGIPFYYTNAGSKKLSKLDNFSHKSKQIVGQFSPLNFVWTRSICEMFCPIWRLESKLFALVQIDGWARGSDAKRHQTTEPHLPTSSTLPNVSGQKVFFRENHYILNFLNKAESSLLRAEACLLFSIWYDETQNIKIYSTMSEISANFRSKVVWEMGIGEDWKVGWEKENVCWHLEDMSRDGISVPIQIIAMFRTILGKQSLGKSPHWHLGPGTLGETRQKGFEDEWTKKFWQPPSVKLKSTESLRCNSDKEILMSIQRLLKLVLTLWVICLRFQISCCSGTITWENKLKSCKFKTY